MPEISDDDLGLLAVCAVDYDTRLPYGVVPERIWSLVTPTWQERIMDQIAEGPDPERHRPDEPAS